MKTIFLLMFILVFPFIESFGQDVLNEVYVKHHHAKRHPSWDYNSIFVLNIDDKLISNIEFDHDYFNFPFFLTPYEVRTKLYGDEKIQITGLKYFNPYNSLFLSNQESLRKQKKNENTVDSHMFFLRNIPESLVPDSIFNFRPQRKESVNFLEDTIKIYSTKFFIESIHSKIDENIEQFLDFTEFKERSGLSPVEPINVRFKKSFNSYFEPFFLKKTEVSNKEYKEFVYWVRDSIVRRMLIVNGFDDYKLNLLESYTNELQKTETSLKKLVNNSAKSANSKSQAIIDKKKKIEQLKKLINEESSLKTCRINWEKEIEWNSEDEEYMDAIKDIFLPVHERFYRIREVDTRKLIYEYYEVNHKQATKKLGGGDFNNDYPDTSSFVMSTRIIVYPDTLVWMSYLNNEPYAKNYFWHPTYDNFPVVGVSWEQAKAFCHWKTKKVQSEIDNQKSNYLVEVDLPNIYQFEYVLNKYKKQKANNNFTVDWYLDLNYKQSYVKESLGEGIIWQKTYNVDKKGFQYTTPLNLEEIKRKGFKRFANFIKEYLQTDSVGINNNVLLQQYNNLLSDLSDDGIVGLMSNVSEWTNENYYDNWEYQFMKYRKISDSFQPDYSMLIYKKDYYNDDKKNRIDRINKEIFRFKSYYKNSYPIIKKIENGFLGDDISSNMDTLFAKEKKDYKMVFGSNWYDETFLRSKPLHSVKTFINKNEAHATIGFRYVIKLYPIYNGKAYEYIKWFNDETAIVSWDNDFFLIDNTGKQKTDRFDWIFVDDNNLKSILDNKTPLIVEKKGEFNILDKNGNISQNRWYNTIDHFSSNINIVYNNSLAGVVNNCGDIILDIVSPADSIYKNTIKHVLNSNFLKNEDILNLARACFFKEHDIHNAILLLKKIEKTDTLNKKLFFYIGSLSLMNNNFNDAFAYLKKAEISANKWKDLAGYLYERRKFKLSSDSYWEVINLIEPDAALLNNAGTANVKAGNEDNAILLFEKSLKQDPTNIKTLYYLSWSYFSFKKIELAFQTAQKIEKYTNEKTTLLHLLSYYSLFLNEPKSSLKLISEIQKINPEYNYPSKSKEIPSVINLNDILLIKAFAFLIDNQWEKAEDYFRSRSKENYFMMGFYSKYFELFETFNIKHPNLKKLKEYIHNKSSN